MIFSVNCNKLLNTALNGSILASFLIIQYKNRKLTQSVKFQTLFSCNNNNYGWRCCKEFELFFKMKDTVIES